MTKKSSRIVETFNKPYKICEFYKNNFIPNFKAQKFCSCKCSNNRDCNPFKYNNPMLDVEKKKEICLKLKGRKSWNEGLTKDTDKRVLQISEKIKRTENDAEWKKLIGQGKSKKLSILNKGKKWSKESILKYKNTIQLPHIKEQRRQNSINNMKNMPKISKAELIVKEILDKNKIEHISQWSYKYGVADFYLPKYNMILECYGSYWHNKPDYIERDKRKNQWLMDNGYKVMILCSEDIIKCNNLNII